MDADSHRRVDAQLPSSRPQLEGLLAERYSRSFWEQGGETSFGRSGLVPTLLRLSRRFVLCALCRSSRRHAAEIVAKLGERSVHFDAVFLIPPSAGGGRQSVACLDELALQQLCSTLGCALADVSRRLLLVAALELEHEEVERREGARLLGSPSKPRPHLRVLLPSGCASVLVPHPRCALARARSATGGRQVVDVCARRHTRHSRDAARAPSRRDALALAAAPR